MPDIHDYVFVPKSLGYWEKAEPRPKSVKYRCSICKEISYDAPIGNPKGEQKEIKCGMQYCSHCGAPMAANEHEWGIWMVLLKGRSPAECYMRKTEISDDTSFSDYDMIDADIQRFQLKRETCVHYQYGSCTRYDISTCDDCDYYMDCGMEDET